MGANDILVFRAPAIIEAMGKLLQRMDENDGLRRLFVQDPAGVIAKAVFPDQRPVSAEINRGNRLLYSLLSNKGFMAWADGYEEELLAKAIDATALEDPGEALRAYIAVTDRTALHQDLAAAIAKYADPELIASLTWHPEAPRPGSPEGPIGVAFPIDIAVDIETFVYAVAVVAVFAVAVAAVFIGAVAQKDELITRLDVRVVAHQLAKDLSERSSAVRDQGTLLDFSRRNIGFTR